MWGILSGTARRMQLDRQAIGTLFLLMAVTACGSLALQSVANQYQLAVATETALLNTATDAKAGGFINDATLAEVIHRAEQAKAMLDEALAVSKTDVTTAKGKIAAAKILLQDAQTYLDTHRGGSS